MSRSDDDRTIFFNLSLGGSTSNSGYKLSIAILLIQWPRSRLLLSNLSIYIQLKNKEREVYISLFLIEIEFGL